MYFRMYLYKWMFPKIGVPQMDGLFSVESRKKIWMMIWGYPQPLGFPVKPLRHCDIWTWAAGMADTPKGLSMFQCLPSGKLIIYI